MALRLNTHRTFPSKVTVPFVDEDGKPGKGSFGARFKVLPTDELTSEENDGLRLLDLVLDSIDDDLELIGLDGERLTGNALLEAAKADPTISSAMVHQYREDVAKKG